MQPITAEILFDLFKQLQSEGQDLSQIVINFRSNYDADIQPCVAIDEDLFDPETNSKLQSLVLLSDTEEF